MRKSIRLIPDDVIVGLNVTLGEATALAEKITNNITAFILFDNVHEYEEYTLSSQGKAPTTREIILEEFYQAVLKAEEDFGHYFLQFSATVGIAKTTCANKLAALKANPD